MFALCEKELISTFKKFVLNFESQRRKITKNNIANILFSSSKLSIVNILSH